MQKGEYIMGEEKYPIPSHLTDYLEPTENKNNEFKVNGNIKCTCNNSAFNVYESNEQMIVKLICVSCNKEILLFDEGKHGWNGFVCKDDFLDRTLPFNKTVCRKRKCRDDKFTISVTISSKGIDDFIEECVDDDDEFTVDDWVDGFEWITVDLQCSKCNKKNIHWLDCETM